MGWIERFPWLRRAVAGLVTAGLLVGCVPQSAVRVGDSLGKAGDKLTSFTDTLMGRGELDAGLRKWSAEDQALAEQAADLLASNASGLSSYPEGDPGMFDPRQPAQAAAYKRKLKEVTRKYAGRKALDAQEAVELFRAYLPFLRYFEAVARIRKQQAGVRFDGVMIPPGSSAHLELATYCMDRRIPAARGGEKMHLVSTEKLVPADVRPLYERLMAYSHEHPRSRHRVQSLVWYMRHKCNGGRELRSADRALLEAVGPGAVAAMESYCGGLATKGKLLSLGKKLLGDRLDTVRQVKRQAAQAQQQLDAIESSVANVQALAERFEDVEQEDFENLVETMPGLDGEVGQALGRLMQMRPEGEIPDNASDYTLISPGVAAHATHPRSGPHHAELTIRNAGTAPYVFRPSSVALMSNRRVQPQAIGGIRSLAIAEDDIKAFLLPFESVQAFADAHSRLVQGAFIRGLDYDGQGAYRVQNVVSQAVKSLVSVVPVIGNVLSAYEAVTGRDWVTGDVLSPVDRGLAIVSTVLPFAKGARMMPKFIRTRSAGDLRPAMQEALRLRAHGNEEIVMDWAPALAKEGLCNFADRCEGWQEAARELRREDGHWTIPEELTRTISAPGGGGSLLDAASGLLRQN